MYTENQNSEELQKDAKEENSNCTENTQENKDLHNEFEITVRKLKIKVRPRGVLAE